MLYQLYLNKTGRRKINKNDSKPLKNFFLPSGYSYFIIWNDD